MTTVMNWSPADESYIWELEMPPKMAHGLECELTISSGEQSVWISIIFGDIFFCAGQSNMQWPMIKVANVSYEMETSKSTP